MLVAAALSGTSGGDGNNVDAHGEDGTLGNNGILNAIDNGDDSGDGGCSTAELIKGQEDCYIDYIGDRIAGAPGGGGGRSVRRRLCHVDVTGR